MAVDAFSCRVSGFMLSAWFNNVSLEQLLLRWNVVNTSISLIPSRVTMVCVALISLLALLNFLAHVNQDNTAQP